MVLIQLMLLMKMNWPEHCSNPSGWSSLGKRPWKTSKNVKPPEYVEEKIWNRLSTISRIFKLACFWMSTRWFQSNRCTLKNFIWKIWKNTPLTVSKFKLQTDKKGSFPQEDPALQRKSINFWKNFFEENKCGEEVDSFQMICRQWGSYQREVLLRGLRNTFQTYFRDLALHV